MKPLNIRASALLSALAVSLSVMVSSAGQEPSPQEPFRTGVDVIRLDVSVLDEHRQPVRGLTPADFTVEENGRAQRIVAVSEVEAHEDDPAETAWMRYVSRDVAGNDLADQLGEGRAVAIVLDDRDIPFDSVEIQVATRDLARYIIDSLGPSDLAAVVYSQNTGKTEDFTTDRSRLIQAVDRFSVDELPFGVASPQSPGPLQGDMRRVSPTLTRDPCLERHPSISALRTVTTRLASVPNRRKTVFLLSIGLPVPFSNGRNPCQGARYAAMRETFREAQRSNVNIHAIDPAGTRGYRDLLQQSRVLNGQMADPADAFGARQVARVRHDFLEIVAEQTGGRAVFDTDAMEAEVDQIFAETAAYYLVGYESTNGAPDGRFRKVEVKVKRPDVSVRARSGYWAQDKDAAVRNERRTPSAVNDLNLSGLTAAQNLVHDKPRLRQGRAGDGVSEDRAGCLVAASSRGSERASAGIERRRDGGHVPDDPG